MPHVLVTGGAGFIGSHLCQRLLFNGHLVTCLDSLDPYYPPQAKLANVAPILGNPDFRFVQGDILDESLVDALLSGRDPDGGTGARARDADCFRTPPDTVVHLAALAGVRPSTERPLHYMRVNVEGTASLLDRARRTGVSHFVFASSSAVYDPKINAPARESDPLSPRSVYGASKAAGEVVGRAFSHLHGLPVTALRFFTVYGPRQNPHMAIHKFARLMARGEPVPVYGDGTSARDYTYVDDVVEGVVRALAHPNAFQTFNLGNTRPVKLADLVEKLAAALGITPTIEHYPNQPADVPVTWADISEAERTLGYRPGIDLEEGLERFVAWFREQPLEPGVG